MTNTRSDNILILGCGGFIGAHLLERILRQTDYHCIGVDLSSRRIGRLIDHPRLTFRQMDIHDNRELVDLVRACETVVSLAALCNPSLYTTTPIAVIESNFCKIYPLVQACCDHHSRLVHFSTSEVYGKTLAGQLTQNDIIPGIVPEILDEATSPLLLGPVRAQRWCYASAKQLLERAIYAYGFERNLEYTIVRPFNFIGPGMDYIPGIDGDGVPRVIACFMDALLHQKPLSLVDGGRNRRCFTAIDDAINAVMLILAHRIESRQRIFNVGNPANEIAICDLAKKMIEHYTALSPVANSSQFTIKSVSALDFYGAGYEDSDRRIPAINSILELLGWQPKIGLDAALRSTVAGFIESYQAK